MGVLTVIICHAKYLVPVPVALIEIIYVELAYRRDGRSIPAQLLRAARKGMAPRVVHEDGLLSEDGTRFVEDNGIPLCACGTCAVRKFSASDEAEKGLQELKRAAEAWNSAQLGA